MSIVLKNKSGRVNWACQRHPRAEEIMIIIIIIIIVIIIIIIVTIIIIKS